MGPLLLERRVPLMDEPAPRALSYVRPLPGPWEELVGMSVSGAFGEAGRRVLRARLEAEPLVATLSPPEGLQGGFGLDPRAPRFTWQAPRLGTSAWYEVTFTQDLGVDGVVHLGEL